MRYRTQISVLCGLAAIYLCGPWFAVMFQSFDNPPLWGAAAAFFIFAGGIKWILGNVQLGRMVPLAAACAAALYVMAQLNGSAGEGNANAPLIAGGIVFLGVWFVTHRILWPSMANATSTATSRVERSVRVATERVNKKMTGRDPVTAEELLNAFEDGEEVTYQGKFERRLPYQKGNFNRHERIVASYSISRNTLTMSGEEKAGLMVWHILKKHGVIYGETADDIRLGLIYGDGKGRVGGSDIRVDAQCAQQYGLRTIGDVARLDASYRSATTASALSTLLAALQRAARGRNPDPEIVELYERFSAPLPPPARIGRY